MAAGNPKRGDMVLRNGQYYLIIAAQPFVLLAPDGTLETKGGLSPGGGDIARLTPIKPDDPGYKDIVSAFCHNSRKARKWLLTHKAAAGLTARTIALAVARGGQKRSCPPSSFSEQAAKAAELVDGKRKRRKRIEVQKKQQHTDEFIAQPVIHWLQGALAASQETSTFKAGTMRFTLQKLPKKGKYELSCKEVADDEDFTLFIKNEFQVVAARLEWHITVIEIIGATQLTVNDVVYMAVKMSHIVAKLFTCNTCKVYLEDKATVSTEITRRLQHFPAWRWPFYMDDANMIRYSIITWLLKGETYYEYSFPRDGLQASQWALPRVDVVWPLIKPNDKRIIAQSIKKWESKLASLPPQAEAEAKQIYKECDGQFPRDPSVLQVDDKGNYIDWKPRVSERQLWQQCVDKAKQQYAQLDVMKVLPATMVLQTLDMTQALNHVTSNCTASDKAECELRRNIAIYCYAKAMLHTLRLQHHVLADTQVTVAERLQALRRLRAFEVTPATLNRMWTEFQQLRTTTPDRKLSLMSLQSILDDHTQRSLLDNYDAVDILLKQAHCCPTKGHVMTDFRYRAKVHAVNLSWTFTQATSSAGSSASAATTLLARLRL